jgi:hypothetical protein
MTSKPADDDLPSGGHDPLTAARDSEPLPKPIQEHLGRQLRSTYNAEADRPAFLGDPAIPPEFERLIRRIEIGEKVHEFGVEAVRQALQPGALVSDAPAAKSKADPSGTA